MKYLNRKDQKRRENFLKIELEYIRLKALSCNSKLPLTTKFFFIMQLNRLSKNFSYIRIKNRCVLTNRAQSIYRDFHLNRSTFKEYISSDLLVGVRKSSW